ncbi:MAG: asparagine synthase (glutamine-hydrolyzing) [Gaiellaceae bacterium]
MCGICGVVQVQGEPRPVIAAERLDWMTDLMTHRGPDDRGTFVDDGIALGVRRLSIIDVEGGHQPFSNEAGDVWAIQNGELYNHEQLRDELRGDGHNLASRCDTEILPHLYERFGDDFPMRLRGDFGLAVWDGSKRRAVLARDRAGVKPLYHAVAGDLLVFASELKSILGSGLVEPAVDADAVYLFLTFGYVPGPRTLLAGVSKLLPGHRLTVADGRVAVDEYWTHPKPQVAPERLAPAEYGERLLEELEEAVRVRLMSDVPLGAMLSGGLDSSVVVALMARNLQQPVKTFSVGFVEAAEDNELADARLVAETFGTDHHELELSFAHDTVDIAELVWHLDEPVGDVSALGFLALSELTAQTVSVALSGQGADELLGGYKKHRAAALAGRWQRVPSWARGPANALAPRAPGRLNRPAQTLAAGDPVARHLAMSGRLDAGLRGELLTGPLAGADDRLARLALDPYAVGLEDEPLAASLYLDGRLALVDALLHYFDHTSMAHSLEIRVPFLDQQVVELCATIPVDLKVRRLTTKHLLKEAVRGLVPDRVIDKQKVGFFRHAADAWFRGQMERSIKRYLLGPEPRYAAFLDPDVVRKLVAEHAGGSTQNAELLLAILMLEVWLSSYLPRAAAAPALTSES